MTIAHALRAAPRRYKRPRNMDSMKLPAEVRMTIEQVALEIYTDMVNSGASLQSTLAAIYLSGSQHAVAAMREQP